MPDRLFADAYLASHYDAWSPREVRDDYAFYLPRIMSAGAVLDVDRGMGTLLHEARQRGHSGRLCGLDPADGMLKRACQRDDIEWVSGGPAPAMFTSKSDPTVMTGHTFQAIVADEGIRHSIAAVRRAIVAGGRFAFETRNPAARAWETLETRECGRGDRGADMMFFECPNGGAVFSTGSIAWIASLAHNDYNNNVARLTGNVLSRFLDPDPFRKTFIGPSGVSVADELRAGGGVELVLELDYRANQDHVSLHLARPSLEGRDVLTLRHICAERAYVGPKESS